jgi:hypothetical protein
MFQLLTQLATKAIRITDLPIMLENRAMELDARVEPFVCLEYSVYLEPHGSF